MVIMVTQYIVHTLCDFTPF